MRRHIGDRPRGWVIAPWIVLLLLCASTAFAQQPAATREISGTIIDIDGNPVANATVAVAGGGPTATTAADGTFKLARVPVTNLTIDVTAEGFTPRQLTVLGARTALQLQVTVARPAPPAPPASREIAGVVTDASRAPIGGATVRVRGTELTATTAADGTFSLPGVDPGEITLDVEAPGQPPTSLAVPADRAAVIVAVGEAAAAPPPPPPSRTIRGRIVDPVTGEGIPAAQVTVKGTGAVIFTEADGTFVIENAPAGVVLLDLEGPEREPRSFEIPAGTDTPTIPLAMLRGEQIVIEGRAPVIMKQNLASGASVVDDAALNRVSAANIDSALQGKLAGANLQFNSGAPGGGAQLRLRGISTINGQSSPLYVIDGVIVSNVAIPSGANAITGAAAGGSASNQDNPVNRIADLNPNDIENIEVLKGASAAALYGSKAANGVVVITTKRGRSGENRVSVTQRVGLAAVSNRLNSRNFGSVQEVMDAYGEDSLLVQAFMDAGGQRFDHEAAITRVPFLRETIASASGGNENGNYYGSVLVRDEPGVVRGTFYEKQSGRLAVGYKLGERVRLGLTANVLHSTSDRGLTNNDNTGTSNYVVLSGTPNFVDLRSRGGVFPANPAVGSGANPLQTVQLFENREDVWRLIGGATASLDAYKSDDGQHQVRVLGNFGADTFNQKNNILSPPELIFEPRTDGLAGTSIDATTTNLNYNIGTGVLWTFSPRSKQFRNALSAGLTYESVDLSSVYVTAQNLTAGQPNVDSGTSVAVAHTRLRTKENGLYLQDEIALLDDRLTLLGGLLGERSSLNGTNRYFMYPKLAAVYSLLPGSAAGREDTPFAGFEVLRVRGAYGEAGNRPNYGQKFTPLNATVNIDGNAGITLIGLAGDPDIEPERQREFEIGADAALKDQKVVAELTFYRRGISNLLLQHQLPTSTGFATQFRNGGSMRNLGVEVALQGTPVASRQVEWTTRGILTLNRSKITDLPDGVLPFNAPGAGFGLGLGAFRLQEGRSATQIVGAADLDEDGNPDVIGNGEPDFRIGWSNIIKAGNFTIGTLVDWQQGSNVINLTRLLYDFGGNSPDPEAMAARLESFEMGNISPYVEDATFVKLREISVAYEVPKNIASQLGPLKTLTVSASGRNLLTFTNYSGLDPEVSNFGNQPIGRNYDVAPYPPSRSFWFSVSAGL
jgi:TonB-dependent starch-binding outer membrane protein SusC